MGDEEVLDAGGFDAVLERDVVEEDVVHRVIEVARVDPEAGDACLRIHVDDEDPVAEIGERRTEFTQWWSCPPPF